MSARAAAQQAAAVAAQAAKAVTDAFADMDDWIDRPAIKNKSEDYYPGKPSYNNYKMSN